MGTRGASRQDKAWEILNPEPETEERIHVLRSRAVTDGSYPYLKSI